MDRNIKLTRKTMLVTGGTGSFGKKLAELSGASFITKASHFQPGRTQTA